MKNKFLPLNAMSAATCLALVVASASAGELGHLRLPTNQTIAIEPSHEAHVIVDQGAQLNGGASFSGHGAGDIEKVRGGVRSWFVAEQPREVAVLDPKSDERQDAGANAFNPATDGIVFFAFNKSAPLDVAQLKRVADAAIARSADVKVIGHADEVGSDRYNMRLSTRRAKAVADYLIDAGVSADQISYVGRGKREPVDLDNPAKNRRAAITFAAAKGVKPQ